MALEVVVRVLHPLLLLSASCSVPPPEPPAEPVRPNIVLITLDTVRADRIGAYGYALAETPALDALAERGVRFEHAYSPYPYTIPSHATLMTGLYPPQHQVRDNGDQPLGPEHETLAEVLRDAGYTTGASVAAFVTSRQWGFSQGFDTYLDTMPHTQDVWHTSRPGADVVDDALAWRATVDGDEPLFLWVHLYDAHMPLEPIEPYATTHAGRPYDAEIAGVDAQIARLVDAFDAENTVFIAVADHGESNGDHSERAHGLYVYNATQHVPLIIAGPGVAAGVSNPQVSLVDVMPTILHHAGISVPEGLAGRPIPSDDDRPVYLESWQLTNRFGFAPHVGIVQGDYKLIDLPQPELYALNVDPGERHNLADSEPSRVTEMQATLQGLAFSPPPRGHEALSTETTRELAALGYLVSERPETPLDELADPKLHSEFLVELQRADPRRGDDSELAVAALRDLIDRYPSVPELRVRLAAFLLTQGELEDAEALLTDGVHGSQSPVFQAATASVLLAQGHYSRAADILVSQRAQSEYSPRYRVQVLRALLAAGRPAEAEALAEAFLVAYPGDIDVMGTLGVHLAGTGRASQAWPLLERAAQADRPPMDVAYTLAMRAAVDGDGVHSHRLLLQEIEHYPLSWHARAVLAASARDTEDWDRWAVHTGYMVRARKDDVGSWRDHAQALFNTGEYAASRQAVDQGLSLDAANPHLVLLDANLLGLDGQLDQGRARFEEAQTLFDTEPRRSSGAP